MYAPPEISTIQPPQAELCYYTMLSQLPGMKTYDILFGDLDTANFFPLLDGITQGTGPHQRVGTSILLHGIEMRFFTKLQDNEQDVVSFNARFILVRSLAGSKPLRDDVLEGLVSSMIAHYNSDFVPDLYEPFYDEYIPEMYVQNPVLPVQSYRNFYRSFPVSWRVVYPRDNMDPQKIAGNVYALNLSDFSSSIPAINVRFYYTDR
ncbi:coat protein [Lake Sarah-associated circular virus-35]|uniref:coat protein n=1 Tax=Lake Sarah-associated circular virus-35 TaxID=1685763 RepID=UPI0007780CB4|nr:coat protein [Lake Sarah-associated circular virus-35]ALE29773.1 coat protein [Lake Sarah-associated circular virus-35]ALE29776.1 coat protein [Lake Sarah-associated circular virus-35]ALE29777.1 coat protein [Lake Sarah-associated circular virus-35]ALE29779.1 coat protein [Lake Sarah-associated circular virus-35]